MSKSSTIAKTIMCASINFVEKFRCVQLILILLHSTLKLENINLTLLKVDFFVHVLTVA